MTKQTETMPEFRAELSNVQHDAVKLHALAQGAFELYDAIPASASAASNALHALLQVIIERAEQLAIELDRLETKVKA